MLDAGKVFATLGFHVDQSGFDKWMRSVEKTKAETKRPLQAHLTAKAELQPIERYDRQLRETSTIAKRGVKAELHAKADTTGFTRYSRAAEQSGVAVTRSYERQIAAERQRQAALRKTGEQATQTERTVRKAAEAGTAATSGLGRKIGGAATLGAGAAGFGFVAAIKGAVGFQQQMARVQAVAGATGKELKAMTQQAMQLGANTQFSAKQAADGMYQLSTAGFKANEVMKIIPGTLSLAAASGVDLASAAELQASSIRGFGLQASDAGHVADVLANTVNHSAVEMTDLGDAMKYIAPVAKQSGQSMESMAAAIGIMGNVGIKGSQAGTSLRTAIVRLQAPTKPLIGALHDMGLKVQDLQGPKGLLPLPQIIEKMVKGSEGLSRATRTGALAHIFGREALSGMLALVDKGAPAYKKLQTQLENSTGAAKKSADIMRNTVAGSWDNFTGSIETAAIKLSKSHMGGLQKGLDDLAKTVNNIAKIFSDPKLSFGDKISKTFDEIGKLHLAEKAAKVFSAIIPKIADAVASAAPKIAEALVHGFLNASIWGQLAIGAFLIKKFGGWAAFGSLGKRAGRLFGLGFAEGQAPVMAAESMLGGGMGVPGGGKGSGLLRRLLPMSGLRGTGTRLAGMPGLRFIGGSGVSSGLSLIGPEGFAAAAAPFALPAAAVAGSTAFLMTRPTTPTNVTRQGGAATQTVFSRGSSYVAQPNKVKQQIEVVADTSPAAAARLRASTSKFIRQNMPKDVFKLGLELQAQHGVTKKFRDQITAELSALPPAAQKKAAAMMEAMSAQMESSGKLPRGTTAKLVKFLEGQFGHLSPAARAAGQHAMTSLQRAMASQVSAVASAAQGIVTAVKTVLSQGLSGLLSDIKRGLAGAAAHPKQAGTYVGTILAAFGHARGGRAFAQGGLVPVLAAPGEAEVPPDRQGAIEYALQDTFGTNLDGLFHAIDRPHYMNQGGFLEGTGLHDTVPRQVPPGTAYLTRHQQMPVEFALRNSLGVGLDEVLKFATGGRIYDRLVNNANRMQAAHYHYVYGGGHSTPAPKHGPYDCSSTISRWLQMSGINISTMTSSEFGNHFKAGQGDVTIWENAGHVFSIVKGHKPSAFGTHDGTVKWHEHTTAGFTPRHIPGAVLSHSTTSGLGSSAGGTGATATQKPTRSDRPVPAFLRRLEQDVFTGRYGASAAYKGALDEYGAISQIIDGTKVGGAIKPGSGGKGNKQDDAWTRTGYTVFNDPPPGAFGSLARGYAELGTATKAGKATGRGYLAKALGRSGELPAHYELDVRIGGKTRDLRKQDRGFGQGNPNYGLDVWKDSWPFFGLNANSKGMAQVRPHVGKALGGFVQRFASGGRSRRRDRRRWPLRGQIIPPPTAANMPVGAMEFSRSPMPDPMWSPAYDPRFPDLWPVDYALMARQWKRSRHWEVANTGNKPDPLDSSVTAVPHTVGGFVQRFRSGGKTKARHHAHQSTGSATQRTHTVNALGQGAVLASGEYERRLAQVADLQNQLDFRTRKYDQTEEVLIADDGTVNQQAVTTRFQELQALAFIQQRIRDELEAARDIALRIVSTYKAIITRLTRARGTDRVRGEIDGYTVQLSGWRDKLRELGSRDTGGEIGTAQLDLEALLTEAGAVANTTAQLPDSTTGATDTGGGAGVSGDAQAMMDQLTAKNQALSRQVASLTASITTFGGPGDLASGQGANIISQLRGEQYIGSGYVPNIPGPVMPTFDQKGFPVGPTVNVTVKSLHPGSPQVQADIANATVAALGGQGARVASRETVG